MMNDFQICNAAVRQLHALDVDLDDAAFEDGIDTSSLLCMVKRAWRN